MSEEQVQRLERLMENLAVQVTTQIGGVTQRIDSFERRIDGLEQEMSRRLTHQDQVLEQLIDMVGKANVERQQMREDLDGLMHFKQRLVEAVTA